MPFGTSGLALVPKHIVRVAATRVLMFNVVIGVTVGGIEIGIQAVILVKFYKLKGQWTNPKLTTFVPALVFVAEL